MAFREKIPSSPHSRAFFIMVDHKEVIQTTEELARGLATETGLAALLDQHKIAEFVGAHDNFIFDCDGVLWMAGQALPDSVNMLAMLRRLGKRVFFVTNNSSKSREEYRQKFVKLGIEARIEEIMSSSFGAADYVATKHPEVRKAYVVGSNGLADELELVGVKCIGAQRPEDNPQPGLTEQEFLDLTVDPDVGAVVCGWDKAFSFYKLSYATLCLQLNQKCAFIATNEDAYDRLPGRNIPGNGCMVASISASLSKEQLRGAGGLVVVGKPEQWLLDRIIEVHGLSRARTCMVGDRLDTDISFGNRGGVTSLLVLTGCSTPADVAVATAAAAAAAAGSGDEKQVRQASVMVPDFVIPFCGKLCEAEQRGGGGGAAGSSSRL